MENKVRLANFSLFDEDLISGITDPKTQLELFLAPFHVSVYYYDKQFFVYRIVHGEHSKARKFDDFYEALDCGREMFHEMDESFDAPYFLANDNLNNNGLISYLKKYNLQDRMIYAPAEGVVGVYYEKGRGPIKERFMTFESSDEDTIIYRQAHSSLDDALKDARERYSKLEKKSEAGYQYSKKTE